MDQTNMTPALILRLDTITGPSVEEAIANACRVADRLDTWVKVNINGIETMVAPGDRVSVLHENWKKAHGRGVRFVSANVIPAAETVPS